MRFKKHLNEGIFDKIFGKGKQKDASITEEDIMTVLDDRDVQPERDIRIIKDPKFINMRLSYGATPFHLYLATRDITQAADNPKYIELLNTIFSHPEFNTARDKDGNTPAHIIAFVVPYRTKPAVDLVYSSMARIQNNVGVTPLHIFARRGFDYVVDSQYFYRLKDDGGNTPAHYYARYKYKNGLASESEVEELKRSLQGKRIENNGGYTPIDVMTRDTGFSMYSRMEAPPYLLRKFLYT